MAAAGARSRGTLVVGAWLNFACAAVIVPFGVLIARGARGSAPADPRPRSDAATTGTPADGPGYAPWVWAVLFGFSGLLALSLEIVWFRLLGVLMKSTAFTFGTLLALYLGGLGVGSIVGTIVAPRVRRPAVVFLGLQAGVALCAAGLLIAFLELADGAGWFRQYLGGYESLSLPDAVIGLRARLFGSAGRVPDIGAPWRFIRLFFVLPPQTSHSGILYSEEFFRLVRDRLSPHGLAVTWAPTVRVHNSFLRAFPHAVGAPGILIGSREPIVIDRAAIARRVSDPAVRAHFAADGVDIERLIATHLPEPLTRYGPDFRRDLLTDFNSDRFPRDEYDLTK